MSIITEGQAVAHLKLDDATDEPNLPLYLSAAESAAAQFLNRTIWPDAAEMAAAVLAGTAGDDPIVAGDDIKAAILLILGRLYRFREDVTTLATPTVLPLGSQSLLQPHRVGLGI